MDNFWEKLFLFIFLIGEGVCLQLEKTKETSLDIPKHRQRRYNDRPNYNYNYDYVEQPYPYPYPNEYQRPSGINLLPPLGVAGLAIKALKTKSVLKFLAGLSVLGGVLVTKMLPPKVIGGINLPFQGKRRKRSLLDGLSEEHILRLILKERL